MSIELVMLATIIGIVSLGCGTTSGGGAESAPGVKTTHDGLIQVDTDGPGKLFLRENHGIGGYDAIVVVPSFVTYQRGSTRLDEELQEVYLVSLEQALVDAADAAHVPIVYEAGDCVLKVGVGFVNVGLARSDSAPILGEMTLVIEYQDSMSGESLLRYAADEKIKREADGTSREDQVRASFDKMIADINIIDALRKATKTPSPPRPGCKGELIKAGLPAASN
jgi:hypothetical protein